MPARSGCEREHGRGPLARRSIAAIDRHRRRVVCHRDRGEIINGRPTLLGRPRIISFQRWGKGSSLEEVERIIVAHPQIQQAFVAMDDVRNMASVRSRWWECDDGCEMSVLAAWSAERLARFQQPVRWLRLPETLKNGGIKISRRALREWVNSPA